MRWTRAQRAMMSKPSLNAVAAAIASQAPLDHAAETLTRKPRRTKIDESADVGDMAVPSLD